MYSIEDEGVYIEDINFLYRRERKEKDERQCLRKKMTKGMIDEAGINLRGKITPKRYFLKESYNSRRSLLFCFFYIRYNETNVRKKEDI